LNGRWFKSSGSSAIARLSSSKLKNCRCPTAPWPSARRPAPPPRPWLCSVAYATAPSPRGGRPKPTPVNFTPYIATRRQDRQFYVTRQAALTPRNSRNKAVSSHYSATVTACLWPLQLLDRCRGQSFITITFERKRGARQHESQCVRHRVCGSCSSFSLG
jgi:hypothetical protein